MASLALPTGELFSVLTISDRLGDTPAWRSLFNWPKFGDLHVEYAAETEAQRNLWAVRLDDAVMRADKPVLLLASGESCFASAWWARLSPTSYVSRVAGALMFAPLGRNAPADLEKFASPSTALPFPSAIVAQSSSDPLDPRLLSLAESWGSGFLDDVLQLPSTPDTGVWQQAKLALTRLTARVVERRMRAAEAFGLSP
jgi:uncharacterized protein